MHTRTKVFRHRKRYEAKRETRTDVRFRAHAHAVTHARKEACARAHEREGVLNRRVSCSWQLELIESWLYLSVDSSWDSTAGAAPNCISVRQNRSRLRILSSPLISLYFYNIKIQWFWNCKKSFKCYLSFSIFVLVLFIELFE